MNEAARAWRRAAAVFAVAILFSPSLAALEADPDNPFPPREELDALGPGPSLSDVLRSPLIEVESWPLAGPFPDQVGVTPRAAAGPFEAALADAVEKRAGLATTSEQMHCAARELGRFLLARGGLPESGLQEFIAARCGALGSGIRTGFLQAKVPPDASNEEVLAAWRTNLDALLAEALSGGVAAAGVWFGREGDRAALVVASGLRPALIEPFSPLAKDDAVVIQGEVLEETGDLAGLVNQGRYGYADCTLDPTLPLPRFRFRCPLAPGDDVAMIELSARPSGRVLANTILRALARRPGAEAAEYRRAALAGDAAPEAADLPGAIHAIVGRIRKQAELPPLLLSATQSEAAAQLAPHLFAASFGLEPPAMGDLAALGLAAGWRVGGAIKNVEMTSGYTPGSRDAARWVDTVLRYPGGRRALLDPKASVLAVGALSSDAPPLLAAVATTYQLFGKEDLSADRDRLLERIARARKPAAPRLAPLSGGANKIVDEVARELPSGRLPPEAALQEAMQRVSQELHRPVRGFVLQALQVEDLPIPEELLADDATEVAVGLGYTRAPDAPWGRYVAIVVLASPDVEI